MPVTFSQIANGTAHAAISTSAGTVNVVYYPNKLTNKIIEDIKADDSHIGELIASWDVMTDEDSSVMFPLERISEFGIPFKIQVIEAIVANIRPNAMTTQTPN